jgi:probable Rubsico expression protein CbbX
MRSIDPRDRVTRLRIDGGERRFDISGATKRDGYAMTQASRQQPTGTTEIAAEPPVSSIDLRQEFESVAIAPVLQQLDRELIGLVPVKTRIREIASLLLVERIRQKMALATTFPTLHMSFTGNPGTGKTTVAMRMAGILHKLVFVRRGHVINVTRDDLVGQYIGHTAPKTKEILKKAMGGVLFIDEAYYLYRPENERDYGQESIEILLQIMESQREDLVVILAGYADRMEKFFQSNPGFRSRIAHHIDFPDYSDAELLAIAELILEEQKYRFSSEAREAFVRYIAIRKTQPLFSNARSIRNALDRIRLRQANRLVGNLDRVLTSDDVMSIEPGDVLVSRVFSGGSDATGKPA